MERVRRVPVDKSVHLDNILSGEDMKFGIALGGGGAKGFAHIGVLEALEENGLKPGYVAGTSIGAIIGAIYSLEGNTQNLRTLTKQILESEEFKELGIDRFYTQGKNRFETFKKKLFEKFYLGTLFFKKSVLKTESTEKLFKRLFGDKTFADLKIPFVCNSFDLISGEEVVFTSGPLYKAVWASCAIPGIFPALNEEKRWLIDGGTIDNIPIEPLLDIGAKRVIAVYLGDRPRFEKEPETGFYITQWVYSFMKYYLDSRILSLADWVIRMDLKDFHWADFSAYDSLIQQGRDSVYRNLDEVKRVTGFWYGLKKKFFKKIGAGRIQPRYNP